MQLKRTSHRAKPKLSRLTAPRSTTRTDLVPCPPSIHTLPTHTHTHTPLAVPVPLFMSASELSYSATTASSFSTWQTACGKRHAAHLKLLSALGHLFIANANASTSENNNNNNNNKSNNSANSSGSSASDTLSELSTIVLALWICASRRVASCLCLPDALSLGSQTKVCHIICQFQQFSLPRRQSLPPLACVLPHLTFVILRECLLFFVLRFFASFCYFSASEPDPGPGKGPGPGQ